MSPRRSPTCATRWSSDLVAKHVPEDAYPEQWDVAGLKEELQRVLTLDLPVERVGQGRRHRRRGDARSASRSASTSTWPRKVAQWGPDVIRYVEKTLLLQTLDHLWREHLVMLDHLRQVIGLRGYGQRDPLNEYKAEAFKLFEAMIAQSARGGDGAADAGRDRAAGAAAAAELPPMEAHKYRSEHRRGRDVVRAACASSPPTAAAPTAIRTIRRPGARSVATRIVPAARARSSSTATAGLAERRPAFGCLHRASPGDSDQGRSAILSGMAGSSPAMTSANFLGDHHAHHLRRLSLARLAQLLARRRAGHSVQVRADHPGLSACRSECRRCAAAHAHGGVSQGQPERAYPVDG